MNHEVVEINDIDQLQEFHLSWKALLAETPRANFFQSLEWLTVYWKHFGGQQKLRVLIVLCDGRPIGILPLTVLPQKTRVGMVRTLTYPLDDWGTFHGPIGPFSAATLLAGMRHLNRTERDWDLIDLRWIDKEFRDRGRTQNAMRLAGFHPSSGLWARTALVDTSGEWDDYWASRKSHWRTNIRRDEKKLAKLGEVSFVRYRPEGRAAGDDDPRWDLFEQCKNVARVSWQGSSTTGTTITHEAISAFLDDTHEVAARCGALDMNLLYVDDRPVAFAYNYYHQGSVFGLRTGFDRSHVKSGAGTLMLIRTIQDSFARGDRVFDLGPAYLHCKRNLWTHVAPMGRCLHYPLLASKSQALRWKRWASTCLRGAQDGLKTG